MVYLLGIGDKNISPCSYTKVKANIMPGGGIATARKDIEALIPLREPCSWPQKG
jgi:hypothetical protein